VGKFKATFSDQELLSFVKRHPGSTTNELCDRYKVTRQDIHHRMKKLLKRGFLLVDVGRGRVQSKYTVTNYQPWRSGVTDK